MTQKISTIVGISKDSFADAAKKGVAAASKTVRGMKWARVTGFELELDGGTVKTFRTTMDVYFDIEGR
jgi:flavin-binding protein dodecin